MTDFSKASSLDPMEQHFRIPGPVEGLSLFLRFLPAGGGQAITAGSPVLYVHGATFPSALSIAHRFDGRSWRDALNDAGFDVWGLDFYGFGHSDRYPEMNHSATEHQPLCVAEDAAKQVETAARFILGHQNRAKLSLISHSWGAMPACRFAAAHAALVDRLVLFAPIGRRPTRRYETPFGRAIKTLNPTRRTFLVHRCTPEQLISAEANADPNFTAFEHRAVLYNGSGNRLRLYMRGSAPFSSFPFRDLELLRADRIWPRTVSSTIPPSEETA
jgi:pimeloyl-ACP methyl ester carboxylesterase